MPRNLSRTAGIVALVLAGGPCMARETAKMVDGVIACAVVKL